MNIFDSQLWNQFLAIAKPYWYPSEEEGRTLPQILWSWSMLALVLLLLLSFNSLNAFNSYINRDLLDVLEQKDAPNFFRLLFIYATTFAILAPLIVLSEYFRKKLALDWYEWLNNYILDKYFHNRAYYQINFQSDIENPDQRISQEIEPIPSLALDSLFIIIEKIIVIIAFVGILWSISKVIVFVLILYSIFGNAITIFLSREGSAINSDKLESEADYRYCLTHVRNNAESIAFFRGEVQESRLVKKKFTDLIENFTRIIDWQRNLQLFANAYQSFLYVVPFLTVAPLYFVDRIDLGEVSQATIACAQVAGALSTLISQFGSFGSFTTLINRAATFLEALAAATIPKPGSTVETVEEDRFALFEVTLQTPNYEQILVQNLSVSVEPGGLLIVGPSGSGKSSLLRLIAGLWNAGTGRLVRPSLEEMLFLPQSPYLILGTLREQLLYPNKNSSEVTDRELEQVLEQVNLYDLIARIGGLDAEVYWENILSLGEQQRLAFARLLVTRPRYVILDEATSALDLRNEENLYRQLQQTETTFISVGHRESLLNYHRYALELSRDSSWRLVLAQDYHSDSSWE